MEDWVDSKAPPRVKKTQGRHEEWIRETMETWPQIKNAITKAITDAVVPESKISLTARNSGTKCAYFYGVWTAMDRVRASSSVILWIGK